MRARLASVLFLLAACGAAEPPVGEPRAGSTAGGAAIDAGHAPGPAQDAAADAAIDDAGAAPPPPPSRCSRWSGPLPASRTLLVIGQDSVEIEAYSAAFGAPAGVMTYTNVADLAGFAEEVDFGTGKQSVARWADKPYPLVLQLGVSLLKPEGGNPCAGDHTGAITQQALDGAISSMAVQLAVTARPVLLRFGYEFDNASCRTYEPSAYKAAFRHFSSLLRTLGATNVKLVWNAWGGPPTNVDAWYPGDDVVDVVAVSVFPLGQVDAKLEAMASFAAAHEKPLMIAESAPQAQHALTDPVSWDGWFSGVFAYIERHDVKVFSYINQDWNAQSVWAAQGIWGDSRLQGSAVEGQWRAAIAAERYLHSSATLYGEIGCSE